MNGMGGGKFEPQGTMTRAMVVTVLYRFQGEPDVKYKTGFSDVKDKDWFSDAVYWAANNKIVNGVEAGKFAPNDNITRQQLAAILMRYAPKEYIKTEERADITGYSDYKKVQAYARDAMSWANATGLITGVTKKTLEPASFATREQFAVILKRFKEGANFDFELAYNAPVYSTVLDQTISTVTDADIYVAVDGKDTNPGTLDKPIATLARAKEMVRELKKTAKSEIVVAFKAGNYGSLDNLTFTAEDAGTADVPIRYTAYGDGDVIFANGTIIKNEEFVPITEEESAMFPEKSVPKIYKVNLDGHVDKLEDSNYIFSANATCYEARYPNKTPEGYDQKFRDFTTRYEDPTKTEFEYDTIILSLLAAKAVDGFSTTEGMKVTGFLRTGWLVDTFKVKSYDKETKHLTFDFSDRNCSNGYTLDQFCLAYEGRMHDTVFFHNLAELLDYNGEYWYDAKTNQLYIYAPDGDYTIATSGKFITLEKGADYISFVGLSFNGSTDNVITNYGDHVTIDKCRFNNIAATDHVIRSLSTYFTVTNCELGNFINGGIASDSTANLARLEESHNVIENNYLHDFGQPQFFADANGVDIRGNVGGRVAHNIFKNGAHAAIQFQGIDCVMEYNIFDNMMMTTDDFGAIYTYNSVGLRDNIIRYNLFTNIGVYGVYLDNNTCGQQVYGNVFYDVSNAVVLHGGRDNDVHDNLFIDCGFSYTGNTIGASTDDPDSVYSSDFYIFLMDQRVNKDSPKYSEYYDEWVRRWPIMYNYDFNPANMGKYECIYTPVHRVRDNGFIGDEAGELMFSNDAEAYGDVGNNIMFPDEENPFFADPTHGDYTVRSDAKIINAKYIPEMNKYGLK